MGVAELLSAFRDDPAGPDLEDVLEELVKSITSVIPSDTAVTTGVLQIDPHDSVSGAIRQGYIYGDGVFVYDSTDTTTAHDGITCLVLIGGYRYFVLGNLKIKAVEQVGIDAEPSLTDSDFGKSYIDLTGVVGDANDIITWSSRGWVETDPDYGPPIYVKNANGDYPADSFVHWAGDDGWVSDAEDADSVKLSAIIGMAGSLTIRVENQTQYAPPGSRQTGGTAAAPLGGTAANLNDDDDETVTTTSALGDLSGAGVADRIIGKISLAEATDLICIEARGILGSAASSSNAMGLYYSTDNGSSWTQAGTGFTLSTDAQNIQRTGAFSGVTDIAVVTEAKNWSTGTNTVAGLNAFDATVLATPGQSWVIGEGAFGVLAGSEGKVARAEAINVLTIYTPEDGDEVYDKDTKARIRWVASAVAWQPATSGIASVADVFEEDQESIASTGSDASTTDTQYSASTPPTQTANKAKIFETLTATVQADRPGQKVDVLYSADIIDTTQTISLGIGPGPRLLAVFVDDESDACDWCIAAMGFGASVYKKLSFELNDTSEHTITLMFQVCGSATGGTTSAFSSTLARRRISVRKRN